MYAYGRVGRAGDVVGRAVGDVVGLAAGDVVGLAGAGATVAGCVRL
jgi:hypothetical protein